MNSRAATEAGPLQPGSEPAVAKWAKLTPDQRRDIEAHINGLTLDDGFYPTPRRGWTCFHCGETFRTEDGARLHFGQKVTGRPSCEVLYPLIEAANAADRADWHVTTWAVDVEDLRRLRAATASPHTTPAQPVPAAKSESPCKSEGGKP